MFGLGWIEILIIAGLISLLAGPAALKKVMGAARQVNSVKNDFTGPRAIQRMLDAELDKEDAALERGEHGDLEHIADAEILPPPD